MFSLRSWAVRMVVIVAVIASCAGAEAGEVQRSRRLTSTSAPMDNSGADMMTMSPTPSVATEAPTAAPTAAETAAETAPETDGSAALLTSSSLFASVAVVVGSVAAAATMA